MRLRREEQDTAIGSKLSPTATEANLNITAQLDELRRLEDGWADGIHHPSGWGNGYGKAPSHDGLDWLVAKFAAEYPDDLPRPYIYPTPEGGIHVEWALGTIDISLEVDLGERTGDWNWVDLSDFDTEGEKALNMDDSKDWRWIAHELRQVIAKL